MKRKKTLNALENQNNQELIKVYKHVDTGGFKANITVSDKENIIFKGKAKVELKIDSCIKFSFEDKDLLTYEQLGLDELYYLNEAMMEFKTFMTTESIGRTMHKELHINLLKSDIKIIVRPTE